MQSNSRSSVGSEVQWRTRTRTGVEGVGVGLMEVKNEELRTVAARQRFALRLSESRLLDHQTADLLICLP